MTAYRKTRPVGKGRKDANHNEIVRLFLQLGCSVLECHNIGVVGFPDLVVGFVGRNNLVEIKNPKTAYGRKGLSPNQLAFASEWSGCSVTVVTSAEDVVAVVSKWRKEAFQATTSADEALRAVGIGSSYTTGGRFVV